MKNSKIDIITVRINIHDYPEELVFEPKTWETWIVGKLKDAGIPIKGETLYGELESGTLHRLDDPTDFAISSYVWNPPEVLV